MNNYKWQFFAVLAVTLVIAAVVSSVLTAKTNKILEAKSTPAISGNVK